MCKLSDQDYKKVNNRRFLPNDAIFLIYKHEFDDLRGSIGTFFLGKVFRFFEYSKFI